MGKAKSKKTIRLSAGHIQSDLFDMLGGRRECLSVSYHHPSRVRFYRGDLSPAARRILSPMLITAMRIAYTRDQDQGQRLMAAIVKAAQLPSFQRSDYE